MWQRFTQRFTAFLDELHIARQLRRHPNPFAQGLEMEFLKPFEGLLETDPKVFESVAFAPRDFKPSKYSFEQHYKRYSSLDWPRGAPTEIVNGLVTAQHLAIYSWFVFPFSSVALLQGLITLEHALRRRMGDKPAGGLRKRLEYAVDRGWIKGEMLRKIDPYGGLTKAVPFADRPFDPDGFESLKDFMGNLPERRNWLAHGNWSSGHDVLMELDLILQLINQLYPTTAGSPPPPPQALH